MESNNKTNPRIYLAHASEDKEEYALPLAKKLLQNGIDVWLDKWEIGIGDSLRLRMESGLEACTHFLVLLTAKSIQKHWVNSEIDAGFIKSIEGSARFMGVCIDIDPTQLPPLLRTKNCPKISISDENDIKRLISDIYGISEKPKLGTPPQVSQIRPNPSQWSSAAIAIAEYLCINSKNGCKFDPQTSIQQVSEALQLHYEDAEFAVKDLEDAGLIEMSNTLGSDAFYPQIDLFVRFDRIFMDFDPEKDAFLIAKEITQQGNKDVKTNILKERSFPEWSFRRFNSALNKLEIEENLTPHHTIGTHPYTYRFAQATLQTRRFVRENSQ